MFEFVEIPHLPESKVALAAISSQAVNEIAALEKLGLDLVKTGPCKALGIAVQSHADMLCHHLGGKQILVAQEASELAEALQTKGFQAITSNVCLTESYPNDIAFNALRVGNHLFGNLRKLDPVICEEASRHNIQLVHVNQGYAKCSAVVVDEQSIITADQSIAQAASTVGLEVLTIKQGHITLTGYPYGFIGGACGYLDNKLLALTGTLMSHPSHQIIMDFLKSKQIHVLELTQSPLRDIGGILPLKTCQR